METETLPPALAGQVERVVRPLAWPLRHEWQAHSDRLFYSGDRRMLANKLRPNYDAMLDAGYCLDAPDEIPAGSVEYVVWNQETHGSRVTYTWRMPLLWKAA